MLLNLLTEYGIVVIEFKDVWKKYSRQCLHLKSLQWCFTFQTIRGL